VLVLAQKHLSISEARPPCDSSAPKENPFSFKHFLKRDTSTSSSTFTSSTLNGSSSNNNNHSNDHSSSAGTSNGLSSQSPSKSATTSSLSNSTGARPKIPQFQSVNVIHNSNSTADSKMKRSPRFSSFDSQSSLSELADERNMHGSRSSNNSFNIDYHQFPSSTTRSYSNYDIEPLDRKNHSTSGGNNYVFNNSSNTTMLLPDFVQDHIIDFNLGNNNHNNNNDSMNHHHHHNNSRTAPSDLPFDLTFNRSPNSRKRGTNSSAMPIALDLPLLDRSHRSSSSDLPPDLMEGNAATGSEVSVQREETYGPYNEPEITRDQAAIDKMQTLPDFLSDGPIHSTGRLADVATVSLDEDHQSMLMRLQQENDRLRLDLDENRRIMMEQSRRIMDMEQQISQAKNLETQYNLTLAESMEQVEENLFASNQRAAEAQAQANKYKQQVKQLTVSKLASSLESCYSISSL